MLAYPGMGTPKGQPSPKSTPVAAMSSYPGMETPKSKQSIFNELAERRRSLAKSPPNVGWSLMASATESPDALPDATQKRSQLSLIHI